jgi:hypothetical protein
MEAMKWVAAGLNLKGQRRRTSGANKVCVYREKEPQVPPLRFAPVGMTILSRDKYFSVVALAGTTELSSRPERSVVRFFFPFRTRQPTKQYRLAKTE